MRVYGGGASAPPGGARSSCASRWRSKAGAEAASLGAVGPWARSSPRSPRSTSERRNSKNRFETDCVSSNTYLVACAAAGRRRLRRLLGRPEAKEAVPAAAVLVALKARLFALFVVPLEDRGHELQDLEALGICAGEGEELQHEVGHQPAVDERLGRFSPDLAQGLGEVLVEDHGLVPQLADKQVLLFHLALQRLALAGRFLRRIKLGLGIVQTQFVGL